MADAVAPRRLYAVLIKGDWYVAELVLGTAYGDTWDCPVWSEHRSTAFLGRFEEAEFAMELKVPE